LEGWVSESVVGGRRNGALINTNSAGVSARGEIVSIQQLRGAAAVAVLCFHAAKKSGVQFATGAAGVDVFFVISGFIMWVISARAPIGPIDFLLRRAVRILPLYWLTTLAVVFAATAWPPLFPAMKLSAAHVLQSLLFLPHRDPNGQPYPVVVPGWTLDYEVFFYLLFAVALWWFARGRAVLVSVVLTALVLLRPFASLADPRQAAYTDPILLEFVAGLWLGAAWTSGRLPGRIAGVALFGAGLAGFAVVSALGLQVSSWRLLLWGVPALAVVAGAVTAERAGLFVRARLLAHVGDASYSIYLVHGLMVSLACRSLALAGIGSGPLVLAASVGCGLAGGLTCHALVERPLGRILHRALRRAGAGRPTPSLVA
jgi:exopolysaccharide production protein ExoZ